MELKKISELVKQGYQRQRLYEIAHSEDFEEAGGIRNPVQKSWITYDVAQLDKYLRNQTRRHL